MVSHFPTALAPNGLTESERTKIMPKEALDPGIDLHKLSILNESGEVDKDLEPDLSDERLLRMHRAMVWGRQFDERMLKLQRGGRMGTFAPIKGQEASQIGAVSALEDEDWFVPSFRETAAEIWRGKKPEDILLVYAGYNEGGAIPEGVNNFPVTIPVGTQTLSAAGIAYAVQYQEKPQVVMVFFGDGATSEGDFHEAMNFAGVFTLPLIFLCQNNQWAISVPLKKQTRSQTLAQKAVAYGIPGIQVDGNDVLAVYAAAKEAADRARENEGPTLIECVTYRMSLHTTADDPSRYRTEEEVEAWEKKDPISRFQTYLMGKDILSEADLDSMNEEIKQEIEDAEKKWKEKTEDLTDPLVMFDYQYDTLPPYLKRQREELEEETSG